MTGVLMLNLIPGPVAGHHCGSQVWLGEYLQETSSRTKVLSVRVTGTEEDGTGMAGVLWLGKETLV